MENVLQMPNRRFLCMNLSDFEPILAILNKENVLKLHRKKLKTAKNKFKQGKLVKECTLNTFQVCCTKIIKRYYFEDCFDLEKRSKLEKSNNFKIWYFKENSEKEFQT